MRFLSELKRTPGKTCILRVDFNVENDKDALRLEASLPTIKFLFKKGVRVLLLSHRGRPKGKNYQARSKNHELSLKEFTTFLENNLKEKVTFLEDIPEVLSHRKVFLLENLRFWQEEEANDLNFAKRLAKLGDFYVNDAF